MGCLLLDPLGSSVFGRPCPVDKSAYKALVTLDFLDKGLHEYTTLIRLRFLALHFDHDVCDDAQVERWLDLLDLLSKLSRYF